jgi:Protein of unknown function (DUF2934)
MVKKKTAGPDNPTIPATTRRRSAKKVASNGADATPVPAAAIDGGTAEALGTSTSRTIDVADDMAISADPDAAPGTYSPSYEEIAEAAYHRYLSRGGSHGQDFEDWLEAERQLRSRR